MKNKQLIIIAIIFLLIINTTYYWEGKLGFWALLMFLLLVLVYFGLGIALLRQIYFTVREKLKDKSRLLIIGLLALVLTLTYFKPFGFIDFDKLEGEDILVAEREGVANCMTRLKLKSNFTFRERNVCFGVTEVKGTYHIQHDTIYFDNLELGRNELKLYEFAVIKNSGKHFYLTRYIDMTDTSGNVLSISKNEIYKLKEKSRTANSTYPKGGLSSSNEH